MLPGDEYITKGVETIEEGIMFYMEAYRRQFESVDTATRRENCLNRFLSYLMSNGHSLGLADLTHTDGQTFIDTLTNTWDKSRKLSKSRRRRYRGALRSFTWFLAKSGVISTDVFSELSN